LDPLKPSIADAAIALLVTALLGIAGYVVQTKASITANATQHQLMQEAGERQRAEDRAGKQLKRVQIQNADIIYPVGTLVQVYIAAFYRAVLECSLGDYMASHAVEFVSPPTQPHATAWYSANPKMYKAGATSPFGCTLPPDDLARLAADPTKRARWVELANHTLIPLLRKLLPIMQTKVCCTWVARAHSLQCGNHSLRAGYELGTSRQIHLAELAKPDVLNGMLPGLGRDWSEITPALSVVYYRTASYAMEWEAVAARWAADDHTLLQPAEPCWLWPLLYVGNILKQTVAKKELELCGSPPCMPRLHQGLSCDTGAQELTVTCQPRADSA
jgi:hypothetical protein